MNQNLSSFEKSFEEKSGRILSAYEDSPSLGRVIDGIQSLNRVISDKGASDIEIKNILSAAPQVVALVLDVIKEFPCNEISVGDVLAWAYAGFCATSTPIVDLMKCQLPTDESEYQYLERVVSRERYYDIRNVPIEQQTENLLNGIIRNAPFPDKVGAYFIYMNLGLIDKVTLANSYYQGHGAVERIAEHINVEFVEHFYHLVHECRKEGRIPPITSTMSRLKDSVFKPDVLEAAFKLDPERITLQKKHLISTSMMASMPTSYLTFISATKNVDQPQRIEATLQFLKNNDLHLVDENIFWARSFRSGMSGVKEWHYTHAKTMLQHAGVKACLERSAIEDRDMLIDVFGGSEMSKHIDLSSDEKRHGLGVDMNM